MGKSRYKDALENIAEGRDLCRQCGEPHTFKWHDPKNHKLGGTWEAADGHAYQREPASVYARQVLSKVGLDA